MKILLAPSETKSESPAMLKAVERYTGVAFKALDYPSLDTKAQAYIDHKVIIFSNLYGVVRAGNPLEHYHFPQGSKMGDFDIAHFCRTHTSVTLDALAENFVIDLRAKHYERFYQPKLKTYQFEFLKNGKTISHWAKHYRGLVTRALALHEVRSEEALMSLPIEGLRVREIRQSANITTLVCHLD